MRNNKVAPEIKYNLLSFNNELVEIRVHKSAKVMSLYLISCRQKKVELASRVSLRFTVRLGRALCAVLSNKHFILSFSVLLNC